MTFASKSNFKNLQDYFQIPPIQSVSQEKRVNIWLEPTEIVGEYILVLQIQEQNLAEKEGIPLEIFPEDIEHMIYGFLRDENQIRIGMTLREPFPIRAPSFKLISATKSASQIQPIVHQMNCDLNVEYSPALAVEKTILILIARILKFIKYSA